MTLVNMRDMLYHVHHNGYVVGAFDLVSLEFLEGIMAEDRRVLNAIPGVREVVTGRAVKEDAKYCYTWLVRFCHPAVIDSYREHPVHVAFADNLFRPVAAERLSIDYQTIESVSTQGNFIEDPF